MDNEKFYLVEKAEFISELLGDNFMRLARALREIQDEQPDIFLRVAKLVGLGKRKAYALARIARQFESVSEKRLYSIGWTKLQIIGRYLTDENSDYLLQLAEKNTAHDLEVLLRGDTPVAGARVVQLYLAPGDYNRLRAALIANGAIVNGSGVARMEAAVMTLIGKVEKKDT